MYIDKAIGSVVSQTFQNWELIIVDDHSTDDAVIRINNWLRKDSRIKAVFNSRNEGIAKSRNNGARMAIGKYVAFIDSDDMFHENTLRRMVDELEQHAECGVVVSEATVVDEKGKLTGKTTSDLYGRPKLQAGIFFDELITHSFVICAMFRRELTERHGIERDEDLKAADDWVFWLDLSAVCNFKYLQEPLSYYRVHPLNLSRSIGGRELYAQDFMIIPEKVFSRHAKLLNFKQRKGLLTSAAGVCELSSLETAKTRAAFYRSIVADIEKLESDNYTLQSELNTIRSGFINRSTRFFSSKIDNLFPDKPLRRKCRKWVTFQLKSLDPYEATFSPDQLYVSAGKLVEDPTSTYGRAMVCDQSGKGVFWYGPYVNLPPGSYTATCKLRLAEPVHGHVLTLDVASNQGATIIASKELTGENFTSSSEWQSFSYTFHLPAPTSGVEFRGTSPSVGGIYLDSITITRVRKLFNCRRTNELHDMSCPSIEHIQDRQLRINHDLNADSLIVLLTPGYDLVNGGILSINSLYVETCKMIPTAQVLCCTVPEDPLLLGYTRFPNDTALYRFDQLRSFKRLSWTLIHVPEYCVTREKFTWHHLRHFDGSVRVNILVQNIDFAPSSEQVQELCRIPGVSVTCTTAHDQYLKAVRDRYNVPTFPFSTYISPELYSPVSYKRKENLILVSPDEPPGKKEILEMLVSNGFELEVVEGLTYTKYKQLLLRAKWVLTFGEGLDAYFVEGIFSGAISFAIYNTRFFTQDFQPLRTVYPSYEDLRKRILEDLHSLDSEKSFIEYWREQFAICSANFNSVKYKKNLQQFYDYCQSQRDQN
jgi:glycosyltransferase involved in cell wall biosynthesis